MVITHLGPKATVEAAGTAVPPDKRDLSAWHNDTFVNGPSWEEFTRAMGIDGDSASKSSGSVYSVSYYRPAPGHREQLEKMLSEVPSASSDTTAGNVLMQHLEGGPWTFLAIARYNSWDDFASGEKNSVAQTTNHVQCEVAQRGPDSDKSKQISQPNFRRGAGDDGRNSVAIH